MQFRINMIHAPHNAVCYTGLETVDTHSDSARIAGRTGDIMYYPECLRRFCCRSHDLVYAVEIIHTLPKD